jgi:hypothetical protein
MRMPADTKLHCRCGQVSLRLTGQPILTTECLCNSCRSAGAFLQTLPGALPLLDKKGATLTAMYRKDHFACVSGDELLREYRLKPDSQTRRVVAKCCNSSMFMEFEKGHWIDIYGWLWPPERRPAPEMRTMVGDLPDGALLPDDLPNAKSHSLRFYTKLIGAWMAMRFRTPQITCVKGVLDGQL